MPVRTGVVSLRAYNLRARRGVPSGVATLWMMGSRAQTHSAHAHSSEKSIVYGCGSFK